MNTPHEGIVLLGLENDTLKSYIMYIMVDYSE